MFIFYSCQKLWVISYIALLKQGAVRYRVRPETGSCTVAEKPLQTVSIAYICFFIGKMSLKFICI